MKRGIFLLFLLSGCSFSRGIELSDLRGKTAEDVLDRYGSPVIVRQEGDQQMWAYKRGECSVLVFLDGAKVVQFAESRGKCPQ